MRVTAAATLSRHLRRLGIVSPVRWSAMILTGRRTFSRDELIQHKLDRIVEETGSLGRTPHQTLSRVLQELRDDGQIQFLAPGEYRALVETVR